MNDFQMMSLANDTMATRRAEADRARLARSGQADTGAGRRLPRTRQSRRPVAALGAVLHRVVLG